MLAAATKGPSTLHASGYPRASNSGCTDAGARCSVGLKNGERPSPVNRDVRPPVDAGRIQCPMKCRPSARSSNNTRQLAAPGMSISSRLESADPFMLADPNGARPVEKASLLAVFPNGLQLLKTHGHTSTNLRSLDETVVDEHYRFVRTQFVWCFEKPGRPVIEVVVDATFMVYVKELGLTIVLQQEREDFRDALRSQGIVLA